ncbi:MAG: DUF6531 domain-containing protein [Candidatus Kapabacteria bacterium]|nr:DUF6531 domain-containing protein [Candidatus Kapabacteria bacterium]
MFRNFYNLTNLPKVLNLRKVLFTAIAALFAIYLSAGAAITTNGLVAYYPFTGGSYQDFSGNGNNGTNHGSSTTTDRFGIAGNAMSFDGSSSYIDISVSLSLNFSISVWFNTLGSTQDQNIIGYNTGGPQGYLFHVTTEGKLWFGFGDGNLWAYEVISDANTIQNNVWYHAIVVRNGTNMKLFLNGILIKQVDNITSNSVANLSPYQIGHSMPNGHSSWYFNGKIDDIRIYNSALCNDEIQELYHEGDNLQSGLVAYYPFTNGSTNDFSGYGNNANNNGATQTTDRFGNPGMAYNFEGTYMDVPNSQSICPLNSLSISIWLKADINQDDPTRSPLSKRYTGQMPLYNSYTITTYPVNSDTKAAAYFQSNSSNQASIGTNILTNHWEHVVTSWDGANINIYCNGKFKGTTAWTGNIVYNSNPLLFARQAMDYSEYWRGSLDDIRIYNRALTPSEVTALYQEGSEVAIGLQTWTTQNLNVDHYQNGDSILEVRDATAWANTTSGAWCYYNNDPANGGTYGKLYNWYAVNDPRGLAPAGWHVGSDAEWKTLIVFLGDSTVAGGKVKVVGTNLWQSPNTGATNESGFSSLPNGWRWNYGTFANINFTCNWWSNTENNSQFANYFAINNNSTELKTSSSGKTVGYGIRLVKDPPCGGDPAPPTLSTSTITSIQNTSAVSGGYNISQGSASVSAKGVCWNTSGYPSINDSKTIDGTGTANFSSTLTNLIPGTMYYVRAYATSSVNTGYGNEITFPSSATCTAIPAEARVPIFRSYNKADVDHFYCTSVAHLNIAKTSNFHFEKCEGYVAPDSIDSPCYSVIYRLYSPNPNGKFLAEKSHYYTVKKSVVDSLVAKEWIYEGFIGTTLNKPTKETMPMFYLWKNNTSDSKLIDHFYTTSEVEKNNAMKHGYVYKGIAFYVYRSGPIGKEFSNGKQPDLGNVNFFTGSFNHYENPAFALATGSVPLAFSFFYSSFSNLAPNPLKPLGMGWSHSYNSYLETSDSNIVVYAANGDMLEFDYLNQDINGNYLPITPGVYSKMRYIGNRTFSLTTKDQIRYYYYKFDSKDSIAYLSSIYDRNNNTISLAYESTDDSTKNHRIVWVQSSFGGRKLNFEYYPGEDANLIKSVSDPLGRKIEFIYDSNNLLVNYKDAAGLTTEYSYQSGFLEIPFLTKIKMPKGNVIINEADLAKAANQTLRLKSQYVNTADKQFQVTYSKDPNADIIRATDNKGKFIENEYVHGSIARMSNNSGTLVPYFEDINNPMLITKIKDFKGNITKMIYDGNGNVLSVGKPYSIEHKFIYNNNNDPIQYTDPNGANINYIYNTYGNLTAVQNFRGTTSYSVNNDGTIKSVTDPLNRTTSMEYNIYGNPTKITDNLGSTTLLDYDLVSRRTKITDANGNSSSFTYDINDALLSAKDALNHNTNYAYDKNYNLLTVTDAKSGVTAYDYDFDTDILKTITNQIGKKTNYLYWEDGSLKTLTKPDGRAINYLYDASGRLSQVQTPSRVIQYTYDFNSNILTATSNSFGYTFDSRDSLDRLISYTDSDKNRISYSYDNNSNIRSITYPDGKQVLYSYFADNLLADVRDWNGNGTYYTYNAVGAPTLIQNAANKTRSVYDYDAAGRLKSLINKRDNGEIINSYTYTNDKNGNQTEEARVEPLAIAGQKPGKTNYTYDKANRIISADSAVFEFDDNGCLKKETVQGLTSNFVFDAENNLLNISGNTNSSFFYDCFGNRIRTTINGKTRKYVHDLNSPLNNVLMEKDSSGTILNYYVYGNGLVSRIKPNNKTEYYHYDFRGSTVAMTDMSASITHKYSYGAYGELLSSEESDSNPYRYVGMYGVIDDNNGFYNMRARYYDPSLGRFISEDPVWSVNLYPYAGGNPVMGIDYNGAATTIPGSFDGTSPYKNRPAPSGSSNNIPESFNGASPYQNNGSRVCSAANARMIKQRLITELMTQMAYSAEADQKQFVYDQYEIVQNFVEGVVSLFVPGAGIGTSSGKLIYYLSKGDESKAVEQSISLTLNVFSSGFKYAFKGTNGEQYSKFIFFTAGQVNKQAFKGK